ncbi:hypothetical protein XELAEV_18001259mg [Xenopus laevis]|uniref:Reverse transcriptase domain-containing protein n=1 Tax=Xenopus laevis TaxID=8355 RepID=A0A974BQI6_XENLA|nr:hypothetical protein XELAEV_18001259mg [Xenopus laevis]
MVNIFKEFDENLYFSPEYNSDNSTRFLKNIQFPLISQDQLSNLNSPVSIEEISNVIKNLKKKKSDGPDGLPQVFYKLLNTKISPFLTNLFIEILLSGNKLPTSS